MASKRYYVCDYCKKEEQTENNGWKPNGWQSVELRLGQYNSKTFDLCYECSKKLGLVKEDKKPKDISEPTTYEKLFDIISEIVNEAIDNR